MSQPDNSQPKPHRLQARYHRLPAQQSIRIFEAAARHMSFTLAGEELAITQSGISKQIKGLENFLGVSLFIRDGHNLHLTEAGKLFQNRCTQALDNLQLAVTEARGSQHRLRLQVPPTFAARWLIPGMEQLRQDLPELELHIETTWLRTVNDRIQPESNELIIHVCRNYPFDDLQQELLRQETLAIMVSPEYLQRHGPIRGLQDLHGKDLIHTRLDGHIHWEAWCRAMNYPELDISQGYEFETLDMALSAAENGIGVVVCDLLYATKALIQQKLVIPFPAPRITGLHYLLLSKPEAPRYKQQNGLSSGQQAYRQWLKAEIARSHEATEGFLASCGVLTDQVISGF